MSSIIPGVPDETLARVARHQLDKWGYDPLDPALTSMSFGELSALDGPSRASTRESIERWWAFNASSIEGLPDVPPAAVSDGMMLAQEILQVGAGGIRFHLFIRAMLPDLEFGIVAGPVTQHFMWLAALKKESSQRWRWRKGTGFDERMLILADGQIALAEHVAACLRDQFPGAALPSHAGFREAASIAEDSENYGRAIEVCEEAKRQGWNGDWDTQIERCRVKAAKG